MTNLPGEGLIVDFSVSKNIMNGSNEEDEETEWANPSFLSQPTVF